MNKFLLLFIPFFILSLSDAKLSGKDYPLTIKPGKIIKDKVDSFIEVPVTLTNKTSQKLAYGSMSCSWQDFYTVDGKDLFVEGTDCDKNMPIILELAPLQSKTVLLRLQIKNTSGKNAATFKIGFNLITLLDDKQGEEFIMGGDFKENIIWSNQITMKL